jgi:sugar-specific transcriptional regulator TrmB
LNLSGYEVLIEKMLGIINMANITLFISIWPDEAVLLDSAIANAVGRGVNVITEVFGNYQLSGDSINLKNCGESSQARLGKRLSVVVRDAEEVIIGEISEDGEAEGIWTTTPGIVLIAKEYIKHDIWGNILIDALGQSQFKQLCEENELLSYLIKNR